MVCERYFAAENHSVYMNNEITIYKKRGNNNMHNNKWTYVSPSSVNGGV